MPGAPFMALVADPCGGNDAFTKLLLHCDGTNGGTTFTDSSSLAQTISNTGGTTSTTQIKFGASSGSFSTVAGLSLSPGTNFNFPGDFTVDFWVFTSTVSTDTIFRRMIAFNIDSATTFQLYIDGSGFVVSRTTTTVLQGATSVATGAWVHVAIVRSGTTLKLFVNGVQDASVTDSTSYAAAATARIASYDGAQGRLIGFMDEIRVSVGVARWTANFAPPAIPYF
jgi:concanavalin A-like lectin/glucanase superfamily protein